MRREYAHIVVNAILLALAAFIVYGRWVLAPLQAPHRLRGILAQRRSRPDRPTADQMSHFAVLLVEQMVVAFTQLAAEGPPIVTSAVNRYMLLKHGRSDGDPLRS